MTRLRRRGGRVLPVVILLLFALFGALVYYQKFYADRARFSSDQSLIDELADAQILEDDPAPADAGWPQWRGPRRDGVVHEPDLLIDWPRGGPKRLWQHPGGGGYSSFAVGGGRAFTMLQEGAQEVVVCYDALTGKERWRYPYDSPFKEQYAGPRSTPTLDGDRLYTVGAAGRIHCLAVADGSVKWQADPLAQPGAKNLQWGTAYSPLVEGDLLLTNPGGPPGRSVVAYDKKTGDVKWSALDDPAGYSSPIAVTVGDVRQVVFFTGRGAVGLSPTGGRVYWRKDWPTSYDVNAATPLAFRARKGDRVFTYVFISSGYNKGCALLKIEPQPGGGFEARTVYEGNQMCNHFSSPVRRRDQFYGFNESTLTCMDVRTGKVLWAQKGFNKGSLLLADDRLLVLGEQGKLALVLTNPKAYIELASARPLRGNRCWTMPVLAGGRLYLRDERQVMCLGVRK